MRRPTVDGPDWRGWGPSGPASWTLVRIPTTRGECPQPPVNGARARLLLGSDVGGHPCLVHVALVAPAVAHVKRTGVSERRQWAEPGVRRGLRWPLAVPVTVAAGAAAGRRVVRRRGGRRESPGHPAAARQRTCTTGDGGCLISGSGSVRLGLGHALVGECGVIGRHAGRRGRVREIQRGPYASKDLRIEQ